MKHKTSELTKPNWYSDIRSDLKKSVLLLNVRYEFQIISFCF